LENRGDLLVIISASRRTDIAAFYSTWFMNRVRAGFCTVPNPMNRKQISRISLAPEEVDAIVFWTRDPRPLLPCLAELEDRGFRYYFQFSLLGYPRLIDPKSPSLDIALDAFRRLSEKVGPDRVVWRYDPIVFSVLTPIEFHQEQYGRIAESLRGFTSRSVVSIVDRYRKLEGRLRALENTPAAFREVSPQEQHQLLERLATIARSKEMLIASCAEPEDWTSWGIRPGKCIDGALLNGLFQLSLDVKRDPSQRDACGCVASRDIGMYDSCLFGCSYCYATSSFERARKHYASQDSEAESLIC
jgi:hypothetical protein